MKPALLLRAILALLCLHSLALRAQDPLAGLCRNFSGYDQNADGGLEISRLRLLQLAGTRGPWVLVLVEERLLEPLAGAKELLPLLERHGVDLADEGRRSALISVRLGSSPFHQDGRFVLALREFLRAVRHQRELEGVLLVGRFPDASLVRSCNWRKHGKLTLGRGKSKRVFEKVRFLRRIPEPVARRADIVLADLDGHWEKLYVQEKTALDGLQAVFEDEIPKRGGVVSAWERRRYEFRDFFHLADGTAELQEGKDGSAKLVLDDRAGDQECTASEREAVNPLARPDISVSRLDALGSAWSPQPDHRDADGKPLLDARGQPNELRYPDAKSIPKWSKLWRADPILERQLLADALELNHAYRRGLAPIAWRPASIACGLPSGYRRMAKAADDWDPRDPACADLRNAKLGQFVDWLASPAILRTLRAHSNPRVSAFKKPNLKRLDARFGGRPLAWSRSKNRLVPSLASASRSGRMNWHLLRALHETDRVAKEPAFYLHTGCEGITPPGAKTLPYDHPDYGKHQGAEALLFFGRGLALVGRAKVFYDEPRGFAEALKEGATIGEAWARYRDVEAAAKSWGQVGGDIGRKRFYFWSVLGDWSLRLRKPRIPPRH